MEPSSLIGAIEPYSVLSASKIEKEQTALVLSKKHLRLVIEGARNHGIFTTDPAGFITTGSLVRKPFSAGRPMKRSASLAQ